MRNLIRALRGKPVELSPKQQEMLATAQARADVQIAAAEAAGRKAQADYAAFRAEQGLPDPPPAPTSLRDVIEQAKTDLGGTFDDRRDVLDPGPGADLNRPPAELEDERERAAAAAAERAHRDAARAPYLAPRPPAVVFTRVGTNGQDQLVHIVEVLKTADPAGVFGVYRVPDRFDLTRGTEKHAYVEWEIAHAPGALDATSGPVAASVLHRAAHLVLRAPGDPAVLDEDVMGAAITRAGLQPEDAFGLTRVLHIRGNSDEDGLSFRAQLDGALLLARTPVPAPQQPQVTLEPSPFYLELLDWEAVAAWNAPWRYGPPRTPAPLPHLPSGWQELMTAYLEIVGVHPGDCYGAQVTRSRDGDLADLSFASFRKNFSRPKLPCADGTPRQRMQAAEHVVIAYRDRAEYAAGRERWQAYQHDVLGARLDHRSHVRPPIEVDDRPRPSFAEEVFDFLNPLDPLQAPPQLLNRNQRPSLGPYAGELP